MMDETEDAFQIDVDLSRNLIRATLRGYWDLATTSNFTEELHKTLAETAAHPGTNAPRLLIDARNQGVQSQIVVATAGEGMVELKGPSPRVATLISSTLHKMQATRIASPDQHRLFSSESEALAWLLADQPL